MGFINPALDAIGHAANYTACFHDITTGNNTSGSSPTKFYAVAGYDLCTGWGTPAGQSLINALATPDPLVVSPSALAFSGGVGGPFSPNPGWLTLTNAGTNALSWTLANTSAWFNCFAHERDAGCRAGRGRRLGLRHRLSHDPARRGVSGRAGLDQLRPAAWRKPARWP